MAMNLALRRFERFVLAGAVAVGLAGWSAPAASAATPSVGAPTATVSFLKGIDFQGSATMTPDVVRAEIVIDVEGATRSEVADVPASTRSGGATLRYTLATPGGSLLPNTDVTAAFRLTLTDGTTIVGPQVKVHYEDTRLAWKTISGTFVRVHYTDGGTSFGQRAVKIADDAIRQVGTLLGVTETDPIDFYVYADRTQFYDVLGPGTRENVGGEAHPEIRTLFANIEPAAVNDSWVGVVIPHELTHVVFDSAVRNAYHYPPRWLNEGIAVYLSEGYGSADRSAVADAVKASTIMPLLALTAQFPTTEARFFLAYSESVSAVSYLVDHFGRDAMVALVRSYAGGVSDDEAFQAALQMDVSGFEAAWLDSIGAPTPSPIGPRPAPAGPLPPGWAGAAPTPGTAAGGSFAPARTEAPASPVTGSGSPGDSGLALGLTLIAGAVIIVAATRRRRVVVERRAAAGAFGAGPEASAAGTGAGQAETSIDGGEGLAEAPDTPATEPTEAWAPPRAADFTTELTASEPSAGEPPPAEPPLAEPPA
jgi:hypothetical protein